MTPEARAAMAKNAETIQKAKRQQQDAGRAAQAAKHAEWLRKQEPDLSPEAKAALLPPAANPPADPNAPMSFLEAKKLTKQIRDHLDGAADIVLEMHRREGWRILKHESWEEYCKKEFGHSRFYANRLLHFAETVELLENVAHGATIPTQERQTRPLNSLPPSLKKKAWKKAVKIAGDKPPTGRQVATVVESIKPAKATTIEPLPADDPKSIRGKSNALVADDTGFMAGS